MTTPQSATTQYDMRPMPAKHKLFNIISAARNRNASRMLCLSRTQRFPVTFRKGPQQDAEGTRTQKRFERYAFATHWQERPSALVLRWRSVFTSPEEFAEKNCGQRAALLGAPVV
jgi:hypothetical protein